MHDAVELAADVQAPEGATGFRVDYVFMSAAFEEDIGDAASDKFYIIVENPETEEQEVMNTSDCINPGFYTDFRISIEGSICNPEITCDVGKCESGVCQEGFCFIDANSALAESCAAEEVTNISGTGYECGGGGGPGSGSSTGWLRTIAPIDGGVHLRIRFHIHDTESIRRRVFPPAALGGLRHHRR